MNQIAEQQGRLSLVLDAAAYGAANWQPRTLNLLVYINRAQLGHQLALGHWILLTLATWDRAAQIQSGQVRRANPPAHLIAMMFGSAHGLAYTQARSAGDNQQALEQAFEASSTFDLRGVGSSSAAISAGLAAASTSHYSGDS